MRRDTLQFKCMQCSGKAGGGEGRGAVKGIEMTWAATLYSSTRGSLVRWIMRGSSVLRLTFIPRAKKVGKGLRW